jgi:hypothetical protein
MEADQTGLQRDSGDLLSLKIKVHMEFLQSSEWPITRPELAPTVRPV